MTTTSDRPMLIIGAGHVGGRAAQALREFGWQGGVLMIGAEPHLPYERPPLSKGLLTGERSAAQCSLRERSAYDEDRITHLQAEVAAIDPDRQEVTLADGRRIAYAAALLATGGIVRRLTIPGADLPGVLTLRTLDDAAALAARLSPGAHLLIVGGGFIGLEVAASARVRGVRVTVVEGAPRLLGRAVPASVAERVHALHLSRGVDVRTSTLPTSIERIEGGRLRVTLASDGQDAGTLDADTVLVGIGIEPATALARAAGLDVGNGVRVDERLATSAPAIFAAGDVAEFPSPLSGQAMRQETWHNAETQARTAARNMLGGHEAYAELPWFWSDQYDHQLQVAGEPALGVRCITRRPAAIAEAEIHFHLDAGGRIVGASGFGPAGAIAKDLKLARTLVQRSASPDPLRLADPQVGLKALL
jgi:3-phenylpropionate/trans-cinnamate dioxygenase ferredoxin reductase component